VELTRLLAELIATPSVNPMGQSVAEGAFYESRLTDYLEQYFRALNLTVMRQPIAPHRDNLLARFDPPSVDRKNIPLLLIDVHQDTVPVEGMRINPFAAEIDGTKMFGRGACDVKGGMAAILHTVRQLVQSNEKCVPTIVIACTVNEENGFSGAYELTKLWENCAVADFIGKKPDACIVTEPTRLRVIRRHKGVVRWRCHTRGIAAHSSQTRDAEHAIYRMGHVVGLLEHYASEILPQLDGDALCGAATLSVGTISGGVSVNTIPDRCSIEIDRRILPSETPDTAYEHAIQHMGQLKTMGIELEHESPMLRAPGLCDSRNGALADCLLKTIRDTGQPSGTEGAAYCTNAGAIAASGVPVVVFGPGSIEQAHTEDEWIDTREVQLAADILRKFVTSAWTL
tara:strand:- start:1821 stop:3017 length:1197 start_codon:yes stop_codon:yes gene_type:complete